MASVTRYGAGWSVRYRYETETGERKMKRVSGFSTKEEAWAAARDLESKSSAGIDVNGDNMTCGELMELWFATISADLAATTRAKYSDGIDKLLNTFVSDLPVRKLSAQRFQLLLDELRKKVSVSTAVSQTEPLRFSLSWAVDSRRIPINPLAGVRLPSIPKRQQRILSDADVESLIAAASSPDRRCTDFLIPLLLVLYGGLRREECAGLSWDDVNFDLSRITIRQAIVMTPDGKEHRKDPKTDLSSRTLSMPTWVMDELRIRYDAFLKMTNTKIQKLNPDHLVCVTSVGKPYSLKSYTHALSRLIREINDQREKLHMPRIPAASFRDLRHTHAAMLIRRNVQPKIISERMGHSSIKITMDTYGYLMPGLQDSVAELFNQERSGQSSAGAGA